MQRRPWMIKFRFFMQKFAIVGLILLVLSLTVYSLFFVNRFYLKVVPLEPEQNTVSYGDAYADPGVQVKLAGTYLFREGFVVDAKVESSGEVDGNALGSYTIVYRAKYLLFTGQGSRSVSVVDTVAPEIVLHSVPDHCTIPGEAYAEEGFTATDNYDGDVTAQVIAEESNGIVTYTVTDSSGNTAQVQRVILYKDTIPPVLSLNGEETIHLGVSEDFAEPGFTAIDNVDGDISHLVTVEGTVDPYVAGSYTLTYTVADTEGNTITARRTVIVEKAKRVETVTPKEKTIYLTFDDGPGVYTDDLLAVLRKYDVKATFFVRNTDCIDTIKDIAKDGHALGIHTISHDYEKIYASEEAFFDELLGMQQIIYEKTGIMTYLMRFPGGSSNTVSRFNKGIMTRLTKAVENAGFYYFDWNVDSDDAGRTKTAKKVFKNVTEGVQKRKVSIVLQHDIKSYSVEAVEKIICWAIENGYQFLPLEESSPGAHHDVNN